MSVIDEIKARIDIVDLVSESVKLRRTGKNYSGFCPFHPNSRTPAFAVFPDSGTWRCFGQCNEGGDIFKYVMKKEGWDFAEALRYLAERAGVELEPLTPQKQAADEYNDRLRAALEEAANFYHFNLTQTNAGKPALEYLHKRGLTLETIQAFGLGYAPAGWDEAIKHLQDKACSLEDLNAAGLVSERQSGGYYDRFRNRITFPIRDGSGGMAGFGARILDPNDVPKFLNSPQTALFDKGSLLYGLDKARKAIRAEDQVVIVEGYLDVIVLHQAGFTNAVSPMGTALGENHLRQLKRFTRRVILALDADAAGEKATLRGLEVARQAMDRSEELALDARGFVRYEARLQADIRVTTIPTGMDPDEVVLRNPDEWKGIVASAKPVVEHVMETLVRDKDVEDAKVKSEIASQVLPLIEDVADPIEREGYRQHLARFLKVDERVLAVSTAGGQPQKRRPARQKSTPPIVAEKERLSSSSSLGRKMEQHCLGILSRAPEYRYALDRALIEMSLDGFSTNDFEHADNLRLAQLVQASLEQDGVDPENYIQEQVPDDLTDYLQDLQQEVAVLTNIDTRLKEDLVRTILNLRLLRINEQLQQLRFMQQDEGEKVEREEKERLLQQILLLSQVRSRLDRALGKAILVD